MTSRTSSRSTASAGTSCTDISLTDWKAIGTDHPPLLDLIAYDLSLLGRRWNKSEIERALHTLDDSDGAISETLRLGSYYNAVSHTDVVYRALRHFDERPDEIPTFPLIVVDEYQDFSEMETAFIDLLASKSKVLIAGDDDQALYSFKNADARFIRELAEGAEHERFPLPYCSRCTNVIVQAVNEVLTVAMANGNLHGRRNNKFQCFVPDKAQDSEAHPKIIHATCTVQNKNAPYVGRYIVEQIAAVSDYDIRESRDEGYPTVLVVGPNPFLDSAFEEISQAFPHAVRRKSEQLEPDRSDGYRYLAKDEGSRLGWRIASSPATRSRTRTVHLPKQRGPKVSSSSLSQTTTASVSSRSHDQSASCLTARSWRMRRRRR